MDIQTITQRVANDPVLGAQAEKETRALLARSASDREFRDKLLTNPRAAMAEYAGVDVAQIPESFNIRFVERTGVTDDQQHDEHTLVLPDYVGPGAELSDAELEAVAGGTSPGCFFAGVVAGAVIMWAYTEYVK